jgi:hypothetical protein
MDKVSPAERPELLHERGSTNWKKLFNGVFGGIFSDTTTSVTTVATTTIVVETPAIPTPEETTIEDKLTHSTGLVDRIFGDAATTTTTTTTTVVQMPAVPALEDTTTEDKVAHSAGLVGRIFGDAATTTTTTTTTVVQTPAIPRPEETTIEDKPAHSTGLIDRIFGDAATTTTTTTTTTTLGQTLAIPISEETTIKDKVAHSAGLVGRIFGDAAATTTTTTTTTVLQAPASPIPEATAMDEKLAYQPGVIVSNADGEFEYILKSEFEADKGKKYKEIVSDKFADFLAKLKSSKSARGSTVSDTHNMFVLPDPAQQPLEHPFKVSIAPDTLFTDPAKPGETLDMAKGFWVQEDILGHDYACFIKSMTGACVTETWTTMAATVTVVEYETVGADGRTTGKPSATP